MLLGWTAMNAQKATSRVMVLIAPSFILSNFTLPLALMPLPLQYLAQIFPMNWYVKFLKEIAFKGTSLVYLGKEMEGLLIMLTVIVLGLVCFMFKETRSIKEEDVLAESLATK